VLLFFHEQTFTRERLQLLLSEVHMHHGHMLLGSHQKCMFGTVMRCMFGAAMKCMFGTPVWS
jgi:hypothetical protein